MPAGFRPAGIFSFAAYCHLLVQDGQSRAAFAIST
jgi:hypothetical protein